MKCGFSDLIWFNNRINLPTINFITIFSSLSDQRISLCPIRLGIAYIFRFVDLALSLFLPLNPNTGPHILWTFQDDKIWAGEISLGHIR